MSVPDSNTSRITQLGTVFVPVTDQDRALEFWVGKLGFEKRGDFSYDGGRWVEVAPPGSANAIALVGADEGRATPSDHTLCAFATEDIAADHATLRARGVDVDAQIAGPGVPRRGLIGLEATVKDAVPPQVCFRDVDGNRFLLVDPGE